MHILLVEDHPPDVHLFRLALAPLSPLVQLSVVNDGQQALDFLTSREPATRGVQPEVIFLDLNLPGKSGFEVLWTLKQDPALKFLPVIVLTTSVRPDDITRCYELGAKAYLVKPSDLKTYFTVVRAAVSFWSACQFRTLAH